MGNNTSTIINNLSTIVDNTVENGLVDVECQFAKYGFEKPKDNKIKFLHYLNGHIYATRDYEVIIFDNKGKAYVIRCGGHNIYMHQWNLAPLKKEWYEDESNFGKVLIDIGNNSGLYIFKGVSYHSDIERKVIDAFSISKLKECRLIDFENFRPATESEVLSLYKEL